MSFFSKKKIIFYTLKQQYFFSFILQFWRSVILLSRTLYLFSQVALCNQTTVVLDHWKRYWTGIYQLYSTLLWIIGFSTVTYIKLWWSIKDLQKNTLKIWGTRSTVDLLTLVKKLFCLFFILFSLLYLAIQITSKWIGRSS